MKVYVYQRGCNGVIDLFTKELDKEDSRILLGELDLPIIAPKKTVKKEIDAFRDGIGCGAVNSNVRDTIPKNAKNIKITYEVDE
jgi:hypothetical protein